MNKCHTPINWHNNTTPAINETNLNYMDGCIDTVDDRIVTFDTTKANQSDLLQSVKNITYNTTTGVITVTWWNGNTFQIDLNIEKIPVSFTMSASGVIKMITADGTEYTADISTILKLYNFVDSDEIDFTVVQNGNNYTVTASIVEGSITADKLQPNFLADCEAAQEGAELAAESANESRLESEGYAVGTQDGVEVPSTSPYYHNNAKYYRDQAGTIVGGHNVSYDPNQGLSDTEMANARANIGAVSTADFDDLENTVSNKVDKVTGKGLSTNDYTTAEMNKLAGIEAQANKTIVDSALSASSTNPVQNKVVNDGINAVNNEVGFNLWDEQWEVGGIDNNGNNYSITTHIRGKNYIPIIEGRSYYFYIPSPYTLRAHFYDSNKQHISYTNAGRNVPTIPSNAKYVRIWAYSDAYGGVYNNDICVNLSCSENGTYKPFSGLRKQITEVNNEALDIKMLGWSVPRECPIQNYMDSNRVFHQRVGKIDLGHCNWDYLANRQLFYTINNVSLYLNKAKGYCYKYPVTQTDMDHTQDKCITTFWRNFDSDPKVIIKDSSYTNADTFKAAMQGVTLYYELETEILHHEGGEIGESIKGLGNAIGMRGWNQLRDDLNTSNVQNQSQYSGVSFYGVTKNGLTILDGSSSSEYGWGLVYLGDKRITANVGDKLLITADVTVGYDGIGGQILLVHGDISSSTDCIAAVNPNIQTTQNVSGIGTCLRSGLFWTFVQFNTHGATIRVKNLNVFNLTALFGAGNEPSSVEQFKAMFPADYYPYCSGGWTDLLWENASPSSVFAGQSINVNLKGYPNVMVEYNLTTVNTAKLICIGRIDTTSLLGYVNNESNNTVSVNRLFSASDNQITFTDSTKSIASGARSTDNSLLIPYRIYGMR